MVFLLLGSVRFRRPIPYLILVGGNGGQGEIKTSASTPSTNEQAKDLILVHIVQLKTMLKAQISGRTVVIPSVHSEKTRLKKFDELL